MFNYEKKLYQVFLNGEGNFVDTSCLRLFLHYSGHKIDPEQLKFILERDMLDKQKLTKREVKKVKNNFETQSKEDFLSSFEYFSDTGVEFDVKNLKTILKKGKDAFSEEEMDEIVRNLDCNYTGSFNYEMFASKKLDFLLN